MFVACSNKHLFFSSGKIGTRTILTIPDITRMFPAGEWNSNKIKKRVLRTAVECLSQNKHLHPIVIVRHPIERYYSGLFEIIGKSVIEIWLKSCVHEKINIIDIQKNLEIFKSKEFWIQTILHFYAMSPESWDTGKELQNIKWQFHVGNWLDSALYLKNEFNATVVDIKNLTTFLHSNNYVPSHKNDNATLDFATIVDEFESPYNDIKLPVDEIYTIFKSVHLNLSPKWDECINNYLSTELDVYNTLTNQQK